MHQVVTRIWTLNVVARKTLTRILSQTRAVGGQRARLQAAYSHKALFHYIALKYY